MSRLSITAYRDTPIRLYVNDEIIDVYFVKNKGSYKAQLTFIASENVKIKSPSSIKKDKLIELSNLQRQTHIDANIQLDEHFDAIKINALLHENSR